MVHINWSAILSFTVIISLRRPVAGSLHGRGPVCFHCLGVENPRHCGTVHECWPSQQCYTEHIIHSNGSRWYDMGCKLRDECNALPTGRTPVLERSLEVELELCDQCCEGDLCNSRTCFHDANNTDAVRCLECEGIDNPRECTNVQTCQREEICLTKETTADGPHVTYTMGCFSRAICSFLTPSLIGKREINNSGKRSSALCQQCCDTDTCNIDLCSSQQITNSATTDLNPSATTTSVTEPTTHADVARNCWDWQTIHGNLKNHARIAAPNGTMIQVLCDLQTDGGGWTILQRRVGRTPSFNKNWNAYKSFFGDPDLNGSFWMGNDLIHELTTVENQTMRVDMCDSSGEHAYAIYRIFRVADESDRYRLHVEEYSGTAGDALITGTSVHERSNNEVFQSPDRMLPGSTCAQFHTSGWWFSNCFGANLNGVYHVHGSRGTYHGVEWGTWKLETSLVVAEMKVRSLSVDTGPHKGNFVCITN